MRNVGVTMDTFMKLIYKVRVALFSRDLFENWIEALFKYVLSSLGLYRKTVKLRCLSGGYVNVEPWIIRIILRSYYHGYIRNIKCVNGDLAINDLVVTIKRDKYVQIGSVKFIKDNSMIYETFIKQQYSLVDVSEKVVIDVGAYIGDSTIYFLLRGADRVIAIEPNPVAYQEMLENIRLNNLMDKVIPLNAGISNKHDKICIHEQDVNKAIGIYYGTGKHPSCIVYVDALTLEDIVERYLGDVQDPWGSVLKMDCEGCEFTPLDISCQILLRFTQIIIEYHGEPYSLINHLKKCGFRVDIIKKPWGSVGNMVGFK
jgi:FkbM family methyltransferase